jgi:hypothetical protein
MGQLARKVVVYTATVGAIVLFAQPTWAAVSTLEGGSGSGAFAETSFVGAPVVPTTADGTTLIAQSTAGTFTGTIAGTFTEVISVAVFSDGTQTFSGLDTCICSVAGHPGTFVDSFKGSGVVPNFAGKLSVLRGTGNLANLHATAPFTGSVDLNTGLASGQYSIRYSFESDS